MLLGLWCRMLDSKILKLGIQGRGHTLNTYGTSMLYKIHAEKNNNKIRLNMTF